MAGGKGERFWPLSRSERPKQFLSLTPDGVTMIQHTVNRLLPMVEAGDIFVVTNEAYVPLVTEQLPMLPQENILPEPFARNTAPCIGLAAAVIGKKYDDAVMLVLPSDHLIKYNEMFLDALSHAADMAQTGDSLVTIGIMPTYPETGYGYISFARDGEDARRCGAYRVQRFVEKPDLATAKEYLTSGQYLWNSGMFVWKLSSITAQIERLLPEVAAALPAIREAYGTPSFGAVLRERYAGFPSVSVDYGIMEKAENIFTIPGNFGWDDVGSWLALERINRSNEFGNVISGDVITIDTTDSIIMGGKRLIAAVGLDNLVVVDTGDAVLICGKDDTQKVKKVIENLKICNRAELL